MSNHKKFNYFSIAYLIFGIFISLLAFLIKPDTNIALYLGLYFVGYLLILFIAIWIILISHVIKGFRAGIVEAAGSYGLSTKINKKKRPILFWIIFIGYISLIIIPFVFIYSFIANNFLAVKIVGFFIIFAPFAFLISQIFHRLKKKA